MRSTKLRSNSSATASWTMKRLAAMQDWPLLIVRALTAVAAAAAEVGARHDDEGVAAAELEHGLLELRRRRRGRR